MVNIKIFFGINRLKKKRKRRRKNLREQKGKRKNW